MKPLVFRLSIDCPSWVGEFLDTGLVYESDEDRMRLAIDLSRENVLRNTGGPFGAAVFETDTGQLLAVGVNGVVNGRNSLLHAETVALMLAQKQRDSYTLAQPGLPQCELVTSCEPCAMCLGAIQWSGVSHVVMGASRDDAMAAGFDEGPVFPESYAYLEERGITFTREVLRAEAASVLSLYRERGGEVYGP